MTTKKGKLTSELQKIAAGDYTDANMAIRTIAESLVGDVPATDDHGVARIGGEPTKHDLKDAGGDYEAAERKLAEPFAPNADADAPEKGRLVSSKK